MGVSCDCCSGVCGRVIERVEVSFNGKTETYIVNDSLANLKTLEVPIGNCSKKYKNSQEIEYFKDLLIEIECPPDVDPRDFSLDSEIHRLYEENIVGNKISFYWKNYRSIAKPNLFISELPIQYKDKEFYFTFPITATNQQLTDIISQNFKNLFTEGPELDVVITLTRTDLNSTDNLEPERNCSNIIKTGDSDIVLSPYLYNYTEDGLNYSKRVAPAITVETLTSNNKDIFGFIDDHILEGIYITLECSEDNLEINIFNHLFSYFMYFFDRDVITLTSYPFRRPLGTFYGVGVGYYVEYSFCQYATPYDYGRFYNFRNFSSDSNLAYIAHSYRASGINFASLRCSIEDKMSPIPVYSGECRINTYGSYPQAQPITSTLTVEYNQNQFFGLGRNMLHVAGYNDYSPAYTHSANYRNVVSTPTFIRPNIKDYIPKCKYLENNVLTLKYLYFFPEIGGQIGYLRDPPLYKIKTCEYGDQPEELSLTLEIKVYYADGLLDDCYSEEKLELDNLINNKVPIEISSVSIKNTEKLLREIGASDGINIRDGGPNSTLFPDGVANPRIEISSYDDLSLIKMPLEENERKEFVADTSSYTDIANFFTDIPLEIISIPHSSPSNNKIDEKNKYIYWRSVDPIYFENPDSDYYRPIVQCQLSSSMPYEKYGCTYLKKTAYFYRQLLNRYLYTDVTNAYELVYVGEPTRQLETIEISYGAPWVDLIFFKHFPSNVYYMKVHLAITYDISNKNTIFESYLYSDEQAKCLPNREAYGDDYKQSYSCNEYRDSDGTIRYAGRKYGYYPNLIFSAGRNAYLNHTKDYFSDYIRLDSVDDIYRPIRIEYSEQINGYREKPFIRSGNYLIELG